MAMWQTNMLSESDESSLINFELYGTDFEGPLPDIIPSNNIVVPNSDVELTDEQFQILNDQVSPMSNDGDNGISHYLQALHIIEDFQLRTVVNDNADDEYNRYV